MEVMVSKRTGKNGMVSVAEVRFSPVQSPFCLNPNPNLLKISELEPELEPNLLNGFRRFSPSSVQVRTHKPYKKKLERCSFCEGYVVLHIGSPLLRNPFSSLLRSINKAILICLLQNLQGLECICVESISK
jgi:hypothetical protein